MRKQPTEATPSAPRLPGLRQGALRGPSGNGDTTRRNGDTTRRPNTPLRIATWPSRGYVAIDMLSDALTVTLCVTEGSALTRLTAVP